MKLIIAEKPSLGRAIKDWLDKKSKLDASFSTYQVTWVFGHMLELDEPDKYDAKYKSWNINLLPIKPSKFQLHVKTNDGVQKQVDLIRALLQNANEVINAGDPDREGQLLIDELLDHYGNKKPVMRLWLSAIDDKSIERAFNSIKNNTEFLGYKLAAETRSQADWLVGMNYSRALSSVFKNYGYTTISIGRVQTPTLKLIVDRDNEVKNFKSKDFYELSGLFADKSISLSARLVLPDSIKLLLDEENRLLDKQPLVDVANAVINQPGIVASYIKESKTTRQPLLFNLSELQAVANKKLGYSAQEVLDTAQILYENKLTSYPRSDCQYMPVSQHADAKEIIGQLLKLEQFTSLIPDSNIKSTVWNDAKTTAHHGIVPTGANITALQGLGDKAQSLFNLIAIRYLMQFYPVLSYDQVEILIDIAKYQFKATGKTITAIGWKALTTAADDDDDEDDKDNKEILPVLIKGQTLTCNKTDLITKKTQKPKYYTEGTLIKAMENIHNKIAELVKAEGYDEATTTKLIKEYRTSLKETAGLGTEATRANIIETLKKRGFIIANKKVINSTELGDLLIFALIGNQAIKAELGFLASPLTTAKYEQYLDEIQNKSGQPENLLSDLFNRLDKLSTFANLQFNLPFHKEALKCSVCNAGALLNLNGQFGAYWKCPACNANYKDNAGSPVLTEGKPASISTGEKCPECKTGNMMEKQGKFGKFIACNNYPTCKYIQKTSQESKPLADDAKRCPTCADGFLALKKGKYGDFLGCNQYPKCKHIEKII